MTTRTDEWTIQSAVVVGDVNGDGIPDVAVAVDHWHHPSPLARGGRCNPPPPLPPRSDFVQMIFGGTLPATVNLADPKVAGFRVTAPLGTDQFGASLAAAGDVNGDGRADLLVGAPGDVDQPGRAYVVYGKSSMSPVDVSDLGDGGFAVTGATDGQIYQAGLVVAGGGDVNGDGRPDLVIGAQWRTPERVAQLKASQCGDAIIIPPPRSARSVAYVVFGGARAGNVELGNLGSSGFAVDGSWKLEDVAGQWLATAGDVNGDGLSDIVIGTRTGALIVYGRRSTTTVNPDSLGSGGIELAVPAAKNATPVYRSVAGVGDVNGDGFAEVIVSSPTGQDYPVGSPQAEAPSAYVIFGQHSPQPVDATKLGGAGFAVDGTRDNAGSGFLQLGDLNGDGVPDFGVLAPNTPTGGRLGSGSLYALFGQHSTASLRLDALGEHGVRVDGSPNTSIYSAGGAGKLLGGNRRFVLVASGESAELVPFTPKLAAPPPRIAAALSLRPRYVTGLTRGFGYVWLLVESADNQHSIVYRLDPQTNRVSGKAIPVGGPSRVITTALGSIWVLAVPPHRDRAATLFRLDPKTGRILLHAQVGAKGRDADQTIPADTISYGLGSLWITYAATGRVYRVDPANGRTVASIKVGPYPQALIVAAGNVWVADREDGAVREVDPQTNRVVGAPINVSREPASQGRSLGDTLWLGITANGDIWLYDPNHDRIVHINPRNRELSFDQPSGANGDLAIAAGATAWIVGNRSVSRVNVVNGRMVGSRLEVDTEPVGAAATPGSVWTTTLSGGIIRINR